MSDLPALLRALLLANEGALSTQLVVDVVATAADEEEWPERVDAAAVQAAFAEVAASLPAGLALLETEHGWRLRTAPELGFMVRRLWPERTVRLSKAALEALSVVAYRQPATRLDVEAVRGVDCGGVLRSLLERELVRIIGRKDEPGRPLLYGTTPKFLEVFSLPNLRALPTLRDLASMRQELAAREHGDVEVVPEAARAEIRDAHAGEDGVPDA